MDMHELYLPPLAIRGSDLTKRPNEINKGMFIQNQATEKYFNIVNFAQTRCLSSLKRKQVREIMGYAERHHIIPKSIGGTNDIDNLVWLTANEHLECHCLLVEMLEGQPRRKMLVALTRMMNKQSHNQQRNYELPTNSDEIRMLCAKAHSDYMKTKHAGKGNPFYGRKHSEESKRKISEGGKGIKKSEEAKKRMAMAKQGDSNPGRQIVICPYCNKTGRSGGMRKHHFSHCKQKNYLDSAIELANLS